MPPPSTISVNLALQARQPQIPPRQFIQLYPADTEWRDVFTRLDVPEMFLVDREGWEWIVALWREIAKGDFQDFPIQSFFSKWQNKRGQISILRYAISSPPNIFSLTRFPLNKVITHEDLSNLPATTRSIISALLNSVWNSAQLIETLSGLADTEYAEEIRQILEPVAKQVPELIALGLAPIKDINHVQTDLLLKLVIAFIVGHPSSSFVLPRINHTNDKLLPIAMLTLYQQDPTTLSRILDVAQELKCLPEILETRSFLFSIDLAALASRRDYLNLEKWLTDAIRKHGDIFIRACISFMRDKQEDAEKGAFRSTIPLSSPVTNVILRTLGSCTSVMSPETQQALQELKALPAEEPPTLSAVDEQSNAYYEKIFRGELTIPQVIALLIKFKKSKFQDERELFECMINNLLEEWQYFPKYPDRELVITGELVGCIIQHDLISDKPLGVALRHILEMLRTPAQNKMYAFAIRALMQFQARLTEWPQYTGHLAAIEALKDTHPELTLYISRVLNARENKPPSDIAIEKPNFTVQAENTNSAFKTLNVETLTSAGDEGVIIHPNEAKEHKVQFLLNNVSVQNIKTKIVELMGILLEVDYPWFSNYLVVHCISQNYNFHSLYVSCLDEIGSKVIQDYVLRFTYTNIKVLLNSPATQVRHVERQLLKNLGAWLGALTLARNKPIKMNQLALKELLIQGYHGSRLIVVIPFVCKVLEQSKHSKVFKPPNPWLMAMLQTLMELYHFAELKLNLKFEVEVLCKAINILPADIEPSTRLRVSQAAEASAKSSISPRVDTKVDGYSARGGQSPVLSSVSFTSGTHNVNSTEPGFISPRQLEDEVPPLLNLANLADSVVFAESSLFALNPSLKKYVIMAVDRAIREVIAPVVERSVSIASITAREIISKDFNMEPNEERMRSAAHLTVQNLAGSLAMVTCKEPFRMSMTTLLRNILAQQGITDQTLSDSVINATVNDNIEVGCSFIEKAAIEKALPEIDTLLASAYASRKKARERGHPWFDYFSPINSRIAGTVPEHLRYKSGNPAQIRIYEDFAKFKKIMPPRRVEPEIEPAYGPQESSTDTIQLLYEKFTLDIQKLDNFISQYPDATLSIFGALSDLLLALRHVLNLVNQASLRDNRDECTLSFSQRIVQMLYKNTTPLAIEVYVILLERVCHASVRVAKEVTYWLLYADDDRKYDVAIAVALLQTGLINITSLDTQLSKAIKLKQAVAIDFTVGLINRCVFSALPVVTMNEFYTSLMALVALSKEDSSEGVISLLTKIRLTNPGLIPDLVPSEIATKQAFKSIFEHWCQALYPRPGHTIPVNLLEITSEPLLMEETSTIFLRVCIENAIDSYSQLRSAPITYAYHNADAFVKLLMANLNNDSDPEVTATPKSNLFTKALTVLVLIMSHHHETRQTVFDQKPFLRIFSQILETLSVVPELSSLQESCMLAVSNALHMVRPLQLSGFTFAWLELVASKHVMPQLLNLPGKKGWPFFHVLMIDLFQFINPFLKHAEMKEPVRLLYKGTLRVLLVLLHDFPEFLSQYHFSFCNAIAPTCIQLRNLVLSGFPRNMRLPDPFTPNLKVDSLPEIQEEPVVLGDYASVIVAKGFKDSLDSYLATRQPVSVLSSIIPTLLLSPEDAYSAGTQYDIPAMNALALYIGIWAIRARTQADTQPQTMAGPAMEVLQHLVISFDTEGRYYFLNAIANQLRYPNSHTHYFSCVLLHLFVEAPQEILKEQITRVLLERLIVNRPHPWGLLITFIELIKNARYNFWSHSFCKCAPDIERLFESVARSCMLPQTVPLRDEKDKLTVR